MNRRTFILSLLAIGAVGLEGPAEAKRRSSSQRKSSRGRSNRSSFYDGGSNSRSMTAGSFGSCAQARAAGYSRMRPGDTGYSRKLDRDGDGIACE
jgi:hypothetical protein